MDWRIFLANMGLSVLIGFLVGVLSKKATFYASMMISFIFVIISVLLCAFVLNLNGPSVAAALLLSVFLAPSIAVGATSLCRYFSEE